MSLLKIRRPDTAMEARLAVAAMIDFLPSQSTFSAAGIGVFKLVLLFLLILALIGLGVFRLILRGLHSILFGRRGKSAQAGAAGGGQQPEDLRFRFGRGPSPQAKAVERILACSVCGVHVPESEGARTADAFFCCEEHRRAHEKDKAQAPGE